jgi:eukaryotic-like serine/threonine-protein kinase
MDDKTTPLGGHRPTTSDDDRPRRVLAGRYELRGLLGQGGMADVELAFDQALDRQVAVKILHARYADDPSFLARFRREAQAAASMNHPNVVAVYDTGDQDGRPFIVMEYVAGRSLKEVLRTEGVLPERAAEIAGDAALALHYSHERGLVHRDIKPANIMISDDGEVKVADFGIARAVNAETVTQTAAVFGTAAYVAPEQAQGAEVDRRTDVYALGCVLYEMLTGQQPFAADSAVALAYKHVQEPPVPPRQLNPEVPEALEAVVLQAMAKDPAHRYQTARDMNADLQRAVAGLPVSAPPPVYAYEQTQAIPDRTLVAPPPDDEYAGYDEYYEEEERRSYWGWIVFAILVLLLAVLAAFVLANLFRGEEPLPLVPVPPVIGLDFVEAQRQVREAGFEVEFGQRVQSPDFPANAVVSTDPEAGTLLEQGSTVTLIINDGPPLQEVPDLSGMEEGEARQRLLDERFGVGPRQTEESAEVEAGRVTRTDPPAGTLVEVGSEVGLVISSGPPLLTLPRVIDLTEADAINQLRNFCGEPDCVNVQVSRDFSETIQEGRVIRQSPDPGQQVQRGADVAIVVSRGSATPPSPSPSPSPPPPPPPPPPTPTPTPTLPPPTVDPTPEP